MQHDGILQKLYSEPFLLDTVINVTLLIFTHHGQQSYAPVFEMAVEEANTLYAGQQHLKLVALTNADMVSCPTVALGAVDVVTKYYYRKAKSRDVLIVIAPSELVFTKLS